jgi:hypothetical protein
MSRLDGALVILAVVAGTAGAQSLADVARKEEARRKDVKKPSRVLTNKDLKASDNVAPPAPSDGQAPAPAPADNADKTDDGGRRDVIAGNVENQQSAVVALPQHIALAVAVEIAGTRETPLATNMTERCHPL